MDGVGLDKLLERKRGYAEVGNGKSCKRKVVVLKWKQHHRLSKTGSTGMEAYMEIYLLHIKSSNDYEPGTAQVQKPYQKKVPRSGYSTRSN